MPDPHLAELVHGGAAVTVATRDEEHCAELLGFLAEWGYEAERLR